jgi:hypothetical protein
MGSLEGYGAPSHGGILIQQMRLIPESEARKIRRWAVDSDSLRKEFDESEHPRVPAGEPGGGQFTGGGGGADAPAAQEDAKPVGGKKKIDIEDFQKAKVGLAHRVTHDRAGTEKFLGMWNEHVQEAPEEFKHDFLGGIEGSMNIDTRGDEWIISGSLEQDGEKIGDYNRSINWASKSAESAYFRLASGDRGQGVGKTLLASNVAMYQRLGLGGVDVHANIDVGGYAWAKYGYVPKPSSWRSLQSDIEESIDKLAGGSLTYTASSWDELSSEQQGSIYDAWAEATHSEFLDSEIESWRDSGQALEDAKTNLAESQWHTKDWALEAVQGYIEKNPDVPFTDKQILDAMSIDYHGRYGDGRDDPEITFHDDKLNEPKGFDATQPELPLPGVEPIKPEDKLTQDMRDGIEREMVKAFNSQAEDNAAEIDPPDYLSENIAEYQSDTWAGMRDGDKFSWAEGHGHIGEETSDGGDAEIDESTADDLRQLASSSDPKAIWAIADSAYGKKLLLGTDWNGKIDFSDPETMSRFNAYVGKKKAA